MTPAQVLVASYLWRYIDFDGYYGDQCMDLIMQFCSDIGGPRFWGNAADTYGQYPSWYIPIGIVTPQPGDIAVFKRSAANGNAGHISLVHHVNANGTFTSMDQNWGTPYCMYVDHGYGDLIGFMRPVIYLNQGADPMDQKLLDNGLAAMRELSRAAYTKYLLRQIKPEEYKLRDGAITDGGVYDQVRAIALADEAYRAWVKVNGLTGNKLSEAQIRAAMADWENQSASRYLLDNIGSVAGDPVSQAKLAQLIPLIDQANKVVHG
jgi:hypothetical protein